MTPILSIVGRSNTGKTSLVEALVSELTKRGYAVATIKHSRKGFDIDREGKDSWRHRKAGAAVTVLTSPEALVLLEKISAEYPVNEICERYLHGVDLVITEGYKQNRFPKIEMFRADHDAPLIYAGSPELLAVVGDKPEGCGAAFFALKDAVMLADLVEEKLLLENSKCQIKNKGEALWEC